jgi:hypothetical protein
MKTMAAVMLAVIIGTSAEAKNIVAASAPAVTVCLGWPADGPREYLVQEEVAAIFATIPVRIVWKSGTKCNAKDAIHIEFVEQTPSKLMPGALAFARPYQGTYIEVFYDRVCAIAQPEVKQHVLAYVLVHEITHILQGIARHSETGIMKAHWTDDEFQSMRFDALAFTAEDIRLVQEGLRTRTERMEAFADTRESR